VLADAAINITIFALFALQHSLFARTRVKRRVARLIDARLERSAYVWISSALLVGVCVGWRPIPGVLYRADGVVRGVLFAVQAAGVLLVLKGAGVIDALELAGIRQVMSDRPAPPEGGTSVAPDVPPHSPLQIRGPFRVIRHPIYAGWMLMVFAVPTMTANRLLFAAISSAYLILAIPWEETSLFEAHGDRYRAYQRTVRWRLVPGVW
jgi:protein-S-isoprenylcysteine O-methyltransferase Ste14